MARRADATRGEWLLAEKQINQYDIIKLSLLSRPIQVLPLS